MKISAVSHQLPEHKNRLSWLDVMARRSLFRILESMDQGFLVVDEGDRRHEFGDPDSDLRASVLVKKQSFYRMILFHGSIGAAEAYMSGCWVSPNLTGVIRLICRNIRQMEDIDEGFSKVLQSIDRIRNACIPNTLSGSRRNISTHYDLSNELFELFLDDRMMYSSALFTKGVNDLHAAQEAKLRTIAEKLAVNPDDHVIEIGTGWGGLAIYLAENYRCRVTTTTISAEQYAWAKERVRQKNLEHLITVLDKDYRKLTGQYDKLVSIEMIEAVGQKYLPEYFSQCNNLVKPGGKMLLQAITIPEQRFEAASQNVDFIKRYIFPGGFLPSTEFILNNIGKSTHFQLEHFEEMGMDYARTLAHWRKRFLSNAEAVRALGFDKVFCRLWEFYFCYCEGGFSEKTIGAAQLTFTKVGD